MSSKNNKENAATPRASKPNLRGNEPTAATANTAAFLGLQQEINALTQQLLLRGPAAPLSNHDATRLRNTMERLLRDPPAPLSNHDAIGLLYNMERLIQRNVQGRADVSSQVQLAQEQVQSSQEQAQAMAQLVAQCAAQSTQEQAQTTARLAAQSELLATLSNGPNAAVVHPRLGLFLGHYKADGTGIHEGTQYDVVITTGKYQNSPAWILSSTEKTHQLLVYFNGETHTKKKSKTSVRPWHAATDDV